MSKGIERSTGALMFVDEGTWLADVCGADERATKEKWASIAADLVVVRE